jgi:hypothetical protein
MIRADRGVSQQAGELGRIQSVTWKRCDSNTDRRFGVAVHRISFSRKAHSERPVLCGSRWAEFTHGGIMPVILVKLGCAI